MRLAYTVNIDPAGLEPDVVAEIIIGPHLGDEVGTGVTLDWSRGVVATKPTMRVEAYDDGFAVLPHLADLFAWLAARKGATSLAQTKARLRKLGIEEIPTD